ncbi:VOC family protein [Pseudazoarcus pumilus]|uniref:Lactoylglutathione lyase n=1 Tax=Pseudazoarcus pumilus TaxID=2067960 RepID=A0A2I6S3Z4_9RHOO|nr:VOC family protein [Pseudazoarcus pumilus]AUN93981.1 lactoylglutathione lyase [Pseudazoarcus pumilus]
MSTRPFRILGIQQIAIGGPDKQRLAKLWVDLFGLERSGSFTSERENVDEDICALGTGPLRVEVDLMQPLDPDRKPAVHTTPLNHVGLWVDDLRAAVEWLTAQGLRFAPGGIRPGAAGHDIVFVHPKANDEFPIAGEGVLIELVQAPREVIDAFTTLAAHARPFGETL